MALVDADNLVLVAAFTKPETRTVVLNNAPYPFGDPRICPDYVEFASGDATREAFALLRPLGDESVVPPTDGKPSEDGKDVELDVALRLV
ncbi:MAG: hypothetical protein LBR32_07325, partial [Propionibacteriaceae bacterium]|nr:hypothetical protein [Propionibacteriaceae bacterium]